MVSIFDEGCVTLLHGKMRAGKTDFSGVLLKRADILDYNIGTNLLITGGFEYRVVQTDIDIFNYYLDVHKNIVVILDEANLWQSSKEAFDEPQKILEMFCSIIGHFRTALIIIIQRKKNVMPFVRELSTFEIEKYKKETMQVRYDYHEPFLVQNVQSCTDYGVEFDTYSFASFQFKLDLKRLIRDVQGKTTREVRKYLSKQRKNNYENYLR